MQLRDEHFYRSIYMCVTAHTGTARQFILTANRIAYGKGCSRYLRTKIDCNSTQPNPRSPLRFIYSGPPFYSKCF
jgi:hypothetical protein